jgi:small nuclear ribonucleoprotein (snRNP)-like protein
VVAKNGRTFEGRLVSIDFRSNLILHESIAEIDPKFNCELNKHLDNSLDYKMEEIMKK